MKARLWEGSFSTQAALLSSTPCHSSTDGRPAGIELLLPLPLPSPVSSARLCLRRWLLALLPVPCLLLPVPPLLLLLLPLLPLSLWP